MRRRLQWLWIGVVLLSSLWLAAPILGAPHPQTTPGRPVYALPGRLSVATGQNFATFLITNDGVAFGLTGINPAVENEINSLRRMTPAVRVKIWGTLIAPTGSGPYRILVETIEAADVIQAATATPAPPPTPTPVPTATPTPVPSLRVTVPATVRAGPAADYAATGTLGAGALCALTGRNASFTWWQVSCPNGPTGWLGNDVVMVSGNVQALPVVAVAAPPTPTPTPGAPVAGSWRASYFTNRDLAGAPALVQEVASINFNWGTAAPAPNLPPDNFSIRFEQQIYFPAGSYLFTFRVDDGLRFWIDDRLVLEDWREQSARTLTVQRSLSGNHALRIEYFEGYGEALLQFSYTLQQPGSDWNVSYYNNTDLSGAPVLRQGEVRGQNPIDQNWGAGSPAPGVVPADNWSARYLGTFNFAGGDYVFNATADDGVRVYIDGILVIDGWYDGYKQLSNTFRQIGAGNHLITVEYYERTGSAMLRVWWSR
jgi:hypothetical protein